MGRGPFRGIAKIVQKAGQGAGRAVKKVGRLFKRKKQNKIKRLTSTPNITYSSTLFSSQNFDN
jgi:hypothetical protein